MKINQLGQSYSYEDLGKDVRRLGDTYSDIVKAFIIGESHDGRNIYLLQIGHGPIPIIITAGVHARETINVPVTMAIIESYLESYVAKEAVIMDFGMRERLNIVHYNPKVVRPFYELSPDIVRNHRERLYYRDTISRLEEMSECLRCKKQQIREQRKQNGIPDDFTDEIISAGPIGTANPETYTDLSDFVIRDRVPYITNASNKGRLTPREYDVQELLNEYTFYIVPLLNPDGYEIARNGFDAIMNDDLRREAESMGIDWREWKYNARGVDLNRNFPSKTWRAKNENDMPGSENETKALMKLFDIVPAAGYLDLHSRGEGIYYYRKFKDDAYNRRQRYIADQLAEVTGYMLMPPEDEIEMYDSGGNTVHYFSEKYNQPAITIETVPEEATFPLRTFYAPKVFREIYSVPLEFANAIKHYDYDIKYGCKQS